MITCKSIAFFFMFLATAALGADPQPAQPEQSADQQTPAAEAQVEPAPPPPPPPGPEVMHPNEHGTRLTPDLARAFARAGAFGAREKLKLTPEQQRQFADRFAPRLMEAARKNEEQLQPALERLLTTIIEYKGTNGPGLHLPPEAAREFGQRCAPLGPILRELQELAEQDLAGILNPDQQELLKKKRNEEREDLKHFEEVLNRWARGEYREGDDPFEPAKKETKDGKPAEPPKPEMQNAEMVAQMNLDQLGPGEWSALLAAVKAAFGFDERQRAAADKLLADYRAKADAVMTPEWKEKLRANRIRSRLKDFLGKQPSRPFFFHLQQEYAQLTQPLKDLGLAFRAELLGLVSAEQRAAAIGEFQSAAATVGLTVAPTDETLMGLAPSQPAGATP